MQSVRKLMQGLANITITQAAVGFMVLGLAVGFIGFVNQYCYSTFCNWLPNPGAIINNFLKDFYGNIAMTLIGTAVTVLVIDRLYERRAQEELKARLVRQIGSRHSSVALPAFEEMDALGWLQDGSMRGLKLWHANWEHVQVEEGDFQDAEFFTDASFHSAIFVRCDFRRAKLLADVEDAMMEDCNLSDVQGIFPWGAFKMNALHKSVMPDGQRYDGRYNLALDVAKATSEKVDLRNPEEMATFYGVTRAQYEEGQQWLKEVIAKHSG